MLGIKIKEILPEITPPTARTTDPIAHIRRQFVRYKVSMVIIEEDGELVGKISIKDLALNIIKNIKRARILDNLFAKDIMKEIPTVLSLEEDLIYAVDLINKVKDAIPILDLKTNNFFILEGEDILGIFSGVYDGDHLISKICEKDLLTGTINHSTIQLYKKMYEKGYDSITIIDILRRPIGIITYTNIVHHPIYKIRKERRTLRDEHGRILTAEDKYLTAEDIMTRNVFFLKADDTIKLAADEMFKRRIGHLPIVDENLTLYGLLNKYHLITLL